MSNIPGSEGHPIDVDDAAPVVYDEGQVPGAPVDLTDEPDPVCSICQAEQREGVWVDHRQGCCGGWFHQACLGVWAANENEAHGYVRCPNCRSLHMQ